MKVLVLLALVAFAMADDAPQPVQDTPEVASARAEHLAAVDAQKALIASLPKEVEVPVYAAPYYNGYYPYAYGAYAAAVPAPYSHFSYGYSSFNPLTHAAYPYVI